jgi:hypothetical protein
VSQLDNVNLRATSTTFGPGMATCLDLDRAARLTRCESHGTTGLVELVNDVRVRSGSATARYPAQALPTVTRAHLWLGVDAWFGISR